MRIPNPSVLAFVMAGGKGSRLHPLTLERGKPAVPFGSKYRIIDFVLSNLVNSGYLAIYVLVQYKAQSLIDHLRRSWNIGGIDEHFIAAVPPQQREGEFWFKGTADAVHQNRNLVTDHDPDIVLVFGADHVYRMDVRQMVAFHLDRGADATISALPVPVGEAGGFGILAVDEESRVVGFDEKPARPQPIPGDPARALASMGNYVFRAEVLMEALAGDAARTGAHDFGHTVIPALLSEKRKLFAYDFLRNEVPGVKPGEEHGYWRDVGTIQAYWDAQMDLLGACPRFDLSNPQWPIRTGPYPGPGSQMVAAEVRDSLIGEGVCIKDARVRRSIIGRGVVLEEGVEVADSIVMDHTAVGGGARVERAIVDRFNRIPPGAQVSAAGISRLPGAHLDPSGIVVLPRGFTWGV
ncbi:MAG: glucose-1-phosphate adenylyltransferase [Candidatus Tectomicrobia bacterium]|uniref:Glucose-1-phosphate adenylyltransferase n=1 Tax=Tectimicrobiota bacterium TaxID=2528274 RepID=A0A932HXK3_UNCTE|nr:glucose-1-phosphate adenylyltransferase [Candidatus Tectomicrobia bacterium]